MYFAITHLRCSSLQIAEAFKSSQRVRNIQAFMAYLLRYGRRWVKINNRGITRLNDLILDPNQPDSITDLDENQPCSSYVEWADKKVMKKVDGRVWSNNQRAGNWDGLKELIYKKQKFQPTEFMNSLTPEESRWLYVAFGANPRSTIQLVIQSIEAERVQHQWLTPYWEQMEQDFQEYTDVHPNGAKYILELLEVNKIKASEFFDAITSVMDSVERKWNTLVLLGSTNCGKSMMLDLMVGALSCAHITKSGEQSQFHLQNVIGKRVVKFEEPRISPQTVDQFKLLLGGEKLSVDRKHQDPEVIEGIPVLISTNRELGYWIPEGDAKALDSRCKTFKFNKVIKSHAFANGFKRPPRTLTPADLVKARCLLLKKQEMEQREKVEDDQISCASTRSSTRSPSPSRNEV